MRTAETFGTLNTISEKTKNNVMTESDFYRLIWSNEYCSTNGIFIFFNLQRVRIEKYFNTYTRLFFSHVKKTQAEKLKDFKTQGKNSRKIPKTQYFGKV